MSLDDAFTEKVLYRHSLGALTEPITPVSGGYLHRMYRLASENGVFALKILNPEIMKRKDAEANFDRAEMLERKVEKTDIPIIPAIELEGRKRHCANGITYCLFPWADGKAAEWQNIELWQCETAAVLLAQIHNIETHSVKHTFDVHISDWNYYAELSKTVCTEIYNELKENINLFAEAQIKTVQALNMLPSIECISDEDMDPKNVLWSGKRPYIIDLECLGYGNPVSHAFQLALQWSGITICALSFEKLEAFLKAYEREAVYIKNTDISIDWSLFLGLGYTWTDWLEYNIKRALRIECSDEQEREMGITQVHMTVERIRYYSNIESDVLNHLKDI